MIWYEPPLLIVVFLCLKTILDHLEHGFRRGEYYEQSDKD